MEESTIVFEGENIVYKNNYNELENRPLINDVELQGNKSLDDLDIQGKLVEGNNIHINGNIISADDTTYENATTESAGLMSASDKTKLNNIEDNAEENVIEEITINGTKATVNNKKATVNIEAGKIDSISVNGTEQTIINKNVDLTVPTKISDLNNDDNTVKDAFYVHTDNNYTTEEKNKLSGVAIGAQVNIIETVKVNGTNQTVTNKSIDIIVPTKTSDLNNDDYVVKDSSYIHTDNNYSTEEKNKLGAIEAGAEVNDEYSIIEASTTSGYSKTYSLTKNNVEVGVKINIPKDLVIKDGDVKTVTTDDVPYEGARVGDKYIDIILNDPTASHIYIPVKDLVDVYTAGNGINVSSGNVISLFLDTNNLNGLAVTGNGLKLALADGSNNGAMSSSHYTKLEGVASGAQVNVIETIKVNNSALTPDGNKAVNISVPAEVTENTVSGWGFTKNAGTITGITMNGSSKGTSGVVDLGTVITSHQDISGKQNITDNTLTTTNKTIPTAINEVNSIAKGAEKAISYSNYSAMITALNSALSTEYNVGQNIYIVTTDVPDLWISSVESTSSTYTYTTDSAFTTELKTNGYVQVGYYKLSALETGEVNVSNVVANPTLQGTEVELEGIGINSTNYVVKGVYPTEFSIEREESTYTEIYDTGSSWGNPSSATSEGTTVVGTFWLTKQVPDIIGKQLYSITIKAKESNKTITIRGSQVEAGLPSDSFEDLASHAVTIEADSSTKDIFILNTVQGVHTYLLDGTDTNVTILEQSYIDNCPKSLGVIKSTDTTVFYYQSGATNIGKGYYWTTSAGNETERIGVVFAYKQTESYGDGTFKLGLELNNEEKVECTFPMLENPWKNSTIDFMGDSITAGYPGGTTVTKTYWQFLGEKLNATVYGYGIGGSTIANGENPMYSRVLSMNPSANLICVFGGTNDFANYNRALGDQFTVSNNVRTLNTTTNTFYGGLNRLCLNLMETYPNATYVLLTPMHRNNFGTQPSDLKANTAGKYLDEYVECIRKVGEWFSIPVIDLYKELDLYPLDTTQRTKYFASSSDGLHPNTLGHEVISDFLYRKLAIIPRRKNFKTEE